MPEVKKQLSFQLSTNSTLFFKLMFPLFWTVFFGAFTISALITQMYESFSLSPTTFKIAAVLFFTVGVLFLFFSFWKLKRVEFFEEHFFVSNYFKHVQYGYGRIASISSINLILVKIMILTLAPKGHFGRKIPFLLSRKRFRLFKAAYPELSREIDSKIGTQK